MTDEQTDILIIGGGLTGLTLAFYLHKYNIPFKLLEKSERMGGVMQTYNEDGFTFEAGPNTGVLATPEMAELMDDLSDKCQLEIADPKAKSRWIRKNNTWHPLPSGPVQAVNTKLFTIKDKFRILGEPFRSKGNNPDESLAELVIRRLGKSFLDYAVDPFISGVYAGDPHQLITKFALPKLYNLEQQYGSFINGGIRKKKAGKSDWEKKATREVFAVKGGLKNLIHALQTSVPQESIHVSAENTFIQPVDDGFEAHYTKSGKKLSIQARRVISTIGAFDIQKLMPFPDKNMVENVTNIPYAGVVQVVLGYKKWEGMSLNAFGGLVPSKEKRDILGILFTSSFFQGRAPEEGCVLSVFAGGVRQPEIINMPDETIKKLVLNEVKNMLGSVARPDLIRIFRYQKAIPQYDITMKERLQQIDNIENQYPGLIIAGNVKNGIGMANRVEQARRLADYLRTQLNY